MTGKFAPQLDENNQPIPWFEQSYVLTIGATSRPWDLHEDVLNRFGTIIQIDVYSDRELQSYFSGYLPVRAAGRHVDLETEDIV